MFCAGGTVRFCVWRMPVEVIAVESIVIHSWRVAVNVSQLCAHFSRIPTTLIQTPAKIVKILIIKPTAEAGVQARLERAYIYLRAPLKGHFEV